MRDERGRRAWLAGGSCWSGKGLKGVADEWTYNASSGSSMPTTNHPFIRRRFVDASTFCRTATIRRVFRFLYCALHSRVASMIVSTFLSF